MRHGTTRVTVSAALLILLGGGMAAGRAQSGSPPTPAASTAVPVLPDDRLGIRTVPLLLLTRSDVRADLALDERQTAEAFRAVADLHARAAALKGRPDHEVIAARKVVDEAQRAWIDTHLTTDQRDRLIQVDLQWEGPSALTSRPVVADTLVLTLEQRAMIRKAVAEHLAARARGTASPADEKALTLTVLNVLSPGQRERWRAMMGRPFTPRLATRADAAKK